MNLKADRTFYSFPIDDNENIKQKLLEWLQAFNVGCLLDNHHYSSPYNSFNCLVAAGSYKIFSPQSNFFSALSNFVNENDDWIFGHLTYDIKNEIENLHSTKTDYTLVPDHFLFVPEIVIQLEEKSISIGVINGKPDKIFEEILQQKITITKVKPVTFKSRLNKEDYIAAIQKIKEHIRYGDCYEINFCQEFFAENTFINPANVYRQLAKSSPSPFSCFYKLNQHYVLCASPERYLKKVGNHLISQPIKGTIARAENPQVDEANRQLLLASEKDKRENVIVVDLVRNDLSKICVEGTVTVDELCKVYSFPTVHQMISTISGRLKHNTTFSSIIKATFPVASMTGAPKKRVMELIEQYEKTRRGIYSGTIGYITPAKNFDLNVVIRSMIYNHSTGYLSYHTGGGITDGSIAESEYEECLVKAAAVFKIFGHK